MSSELFVHSIGTVAIDLPDRRVGPSAGRPFALLLYLASQRGQPSSRRTVQELIFGGSPRGRSAQSLRQLLYRVRSVGWPIDADDDQIVLTVDRVSIDWVDLLNANTIDDGALEQLSRGLFPGYAPNISEAFRDWFDGECTSIVRRLSSCLTTQLGQLRHAGRWDLVDSTSRALLAIDPLSEEGTLAKAEALAVSGSKRAALGVIDGYLHEVGEQRPQLKLVPSRLKRRISEQLPDDAPRAVDERLFVGREESMRVLSALGVSTRAGNQQVLVLWGEPGIGKTRLVAEYRAFAALQGTLAVSLSCQPHDVLRPLGILGDLVMQLLEAPGSLGCDPGGRALLQRLVNVNQELDGSREAMVAQVSIAALVRSLSDLISAVAIESPLLIFIDDAQWMDENSRTAITSAFAGNTPRRSSLVLASRERAILPAATSYAQGVGSVRLKPLDRGAALALARALLQSSGPCDVDVTAREAVEQARGNPFVIRMLCAHYQATNDAESLKHSLTDILARRLERLPSVARRTLESAVILAKNCTLERLERLLEIPRQQLLRAIEELDEQGLIDVNDGYVVNSHALLADAVTEQTAPSVRRLLHGAAAQLLHNDVDASATGALLWDCAEHWRQSGNNARAISVLLECADRSVHTGRVTDALLTLRHALALDVPNERRLSVVEKALEIASDSSVHVELRYFVSELARLRAALGQPVHVHDNFELLDYAATKHDGLTNDVRHVVPRLRACISATDASPRHRIRAAYQLLVYADLMLDREAAHCAYELRNLIASIPDADMSPAKRAGFEMIYETGFGDPERARAAARAVVACAKVDSPQHYASLVNAALAQYRIAPPSESEETLRLALEGARRYEFVFAEMDVALTLARLFWSTERLEECVSYFRLVTDLMVDCTDAELSADYCILGARLATTQGRYDEAAEFIGRARAFPHSQLALPDLLLRCCELDLRLATSDETVPDEELNELLSLHCLARGFGLQDEVMATVLKCLDRNGRHDEGAALLDEYLCDHRRDGFPVPSWLTQRIDRRQAHDVEVFTTPASVELRRFYRPETMGR